MGTTSEKLQYLATTKTLLKNKINITGANITTDTFRQYPTKLQNALLNCWNNEGEPIFTNWNTKVNGEGTNVKLDNTINARMKLTPKGNTTQNGTPTPSSPINVNVVSGDNEVDIVGKNLYKGSKDWTGTWVNTDKWLDDTQTYNGLAVKKRYNSWSGLYKEINVVQGKTYTFSFYAKSDTARQISIYLTGGTGGMTPQSNSFTTTTDWVRYSITFNVLNTGTIRARVENTSDSSTNATYVCGYQLEEGNLTDYEAPQFYTLYLGVDNLLDITKLVNGYWYTNGVLTSNQNWSYVNQKIQVLPNTAYTLSRSTSSTTPSQFSIEEFASDGTFVKHNALYQAAGIHSYTITTQPTTAYVYCQWNNTHTYTDLQFEIGSKANSYSEYGVPPIQLCDIGNYQDRIFKTSGKNVCNITSANGYGYSSGLPVGPAWDLVIDSFDSNNITYHTNNAGYIYALTNVIQLEPSTQYTISFSRTTTATNNQFFIYDYNNGTYTINFRDNNTNIFEKTFTTNSLGKIVLAFGYNNTTTGTTTISNIQIEKSSTKSTYEPFGSGKWYLHKEIGKVVLNGSETWSNAKNTTDTYIHFSTTAIDGLNINGYGISNREVYYTGGLWTNDVLGFEILTNAYNLRLRVPATILSDISTVQNAKTSFLSWLGNNNITVYYVLSTPTDTEITNTTLINQLESLKGAMSYEEQTNISSGFMIVGASALGELN